jgi:hypothetical protein
MQPAKKCQEIDVQSLTWQGQADAWTHRLKKCRQYITEKNARVDYCYTGSFFCGVSNTAI